MATAHTAGAGVRGSESETGLRHLPQLATLPEKQEPVVGKYNTTPSTKELGAFMYLFVNHYQIYIVVVLYVSVETIILSVEFIITCIYNWL